MSVKDYKCPGCGAKLKWDAEEQKMKCDYCDNVYDIDTLEEFSREETDKPADNYQWTPYSDNGEVSGLRVYVCKSCGGEISATGDTAATSCPYCDSPVVLDNNVSGVLKPDLIIPFCKTKEEAQEEMKKFCKGKPLLPPTFISEHRIEEVKGIYVPFWLYNCDAAGKMRFDATKVKKWSTDDFDYTKTEHYMVIREGSALFDNVPVNGSTNVEAHYMEAIEPFEATEGKPFQDAYLSGYLADKYNIDSVEAQPRANERVKKGMEQLLRRTVVGYDTVNTESSSMHLETGKIRYAMMPVWLLSTRYRGKVYKFAMNAQTGKFVGELPISWRKFWGIFALITGIVTAVGTVLQIFM
ncbi:MAG: hypothetical protein EGR45_05925 [Ruminococcaceae bacterium]|nr:hypothetical protein [Oscillospiraceae bacterium]